MCVWETLMINDQLRGTHHLVVIRLKYEEKQQLWVILPLPLSSWSPSFFVTLLSDIVRTTLPYRSYIFWNFYSEVSSPLWCWTALLIANKQSCPCHVNSVAFQVWFRNFNSWWSPKTLKSPFSAHSLWGIGLPLRSSCINDICGLRVFSARVFCNCFPSSFRWDQRVLATILRLFYITLISYSPSCPACSCMCFHWPILMFSPFGAHDLQYLPTTMLTPVSLLTVLKEMWPFPPL